MKKIRVIGIVVFAIALPLAVITGCSSPANTPPPANQPPVANAGNFGALAAANVKNSNSSVSDGAVSLLRDVTQRVGASWAEYGNRPPYY